MTTTIITGASSGLGAEMARQLAAAGEDLGLCARRTDRLEDLRREILAAHPGRRVEVAPLDVTDDEAVFAVFGDLAARFGHVDRIVINAGIGKGASIGTGRHAANKATVLTNFVGALIQAEAAMEIFRRQQRGHLVLISSMSALRGMPKAMTAYAASKAGVANLAEGIRLDLLAEPDLAIDVSAIFPGFIRSEMNEGMARTPLMVDTRVGVRAMVAAIEARKPVAHVPPWPWVPMGVALRVAPLPLLRRLV